MTDKYRKPSISGLVIGLLSPDSLITALAEAEEGDLSFKVEGYGQENTIRHSNRKLLSRGFTLTEIETIDKIIAGLRIGAEDTLGRIRRSSERE